MSALSVGDRHAVDALAAAYATAHHRAAADDPDAFGAWAADTYAAAWAALTWRTGLSDPAALLFAVGEYA